MDEQENKILGELLKQLGEGKIIVLNQIAERIEPLLKALGNGYYRNRADVEDAIGDLYIKLYQNAAKFRENTNAAAWIIKVFENGIKSDLRSMKMEREFLKENEANFRASNELDEKYIENHLFLQEIFDRLTEEERRLVVYYYWCKCSIREVAAILHKTKSTIDRKLKKLEEKVKSFENFLN